MVSTSGQNRHLLIWATIPVFGALGYLWFKKRRAFGDNGNNNECKKVIVPNLKSDTKTIGTDVKTDALEIPPKNVARSLSKTDSSAPIDIVIPKNLRSQKSAPVHISDEDLDLQIEKIKSAKNNYARSTSATELTSGNNNTIEPKVANFRPTLRPASPLAFPDVTPQDNSPRVIKCNPQKVVVSTPPPPMAQTESLFGEHQCCAVKETASEASVPAEKCTSHDDNVTNDSPIGNDLNIDVQNPERDSANHSPSEIMLGSPSLSSITSEDSNDSGRGRSDVVVSPQLGSSDMAGRAEVDELVDVVAAANDRAAAHVDQLAPFPHFLGPFPELPRPVYFEFEIPNEQVGRLIGQGGNTITSLKLRSNAHILVKNHYSASQFKICRIEGTEEAVDAAINLIRSKFPADRYPNITLHQYIHFPELSNAMWVKLVIGINNNTVVLCMVTPGQFFVTQPAHPSYPKLAFLSANMTAFYESNETPMLEQPQPNSICAAYSEDHWYRAAIVSTDVEQDVSQIIFLDYGGYCYVENRNLRKICPPFLDIPFQAAECLLANVRPANGEVWSEHAYNTVAQITGGMHTITQVVGYAPGDVPLVVMFLLGATCYVSLNDELVRMGFAQYVVVPEGMEQPAEIQQPMEMHPHMEINQPLEQLQVEEVQEPQEGPAAVGEGGSSEAAA